MTVDTQNIKQKKMIMIIVLKSLFVFALNTRQVTTVVQAALD